MRKLRDDYLKVARLCPAALLTYTTAQAGKEQHEASTQLDDF
jgi:hypothetical protein